jgi:hypothetical protein
MHKVTPITQTAKCARKDGCPERPYEIDPIRLNVIRRQLTEALNKAVTSAQSAYEFNAGSFTAEALSDVHTIRKMLKRFGLGEAAE